MQDSVVTGRYRKRKEIMIIFALLFRIFSMGIATQPSMPCTPEAILFAENNLLVGRAIAVVIVRVVKAVLRAKEQAGDDKNNRQHRQNRLDIHNKKRDEEKWRSLDPSNSHLRRNLNMSKAKRPLRFDILQMAS